MIILADTSTPVCRLSFVRGDERHDTEWEADRELAKGFLGYLESELQRQGKTFGDVRGIGAYRGPGSFTGLRIGLTVLNTLADALQVPIVGATGDDWQFVSLAKLQRNEDEKILLPLYGSDARITPPRK